MAQLRQDHPEFVARDAEILVIGPDSPAEFRAYWQQETVPFVGLPDPDHKVSNLYGQEVKWLKFGRMPALAVIDQHGRVRYRHYGASMRDIPPNEDVLAVLDALNAELSV
jgi:peroxiredoxin Q/BCP